MRPAIFIVTALPSELAPIARRLDLRAEGALWRGDADGRPIVAGATGIGRERALRVAAALIDRERPRAVLIAGIAGALDPKLRIGDAVVAAEVVDATTGRRLVPVIAASTRGSIVTVDRVAWSRAEKERLRRDHGADAVDMESSAVAAACDDRGVAWACVRTISDLAADDLPVEIDGLSDADGRPRIARAVRLVLRRPRLGPALLRLGRDARIATDALADRVATLLDALPG